jgi:MFS family permease
VPFFSDPLQDYIFGRRGAIALACLVSIAATIGQSFSTNVAQLLGCRLLTGITLATKASAAPLLIAEIAPDHLRGLYNFMITQKSCILS